MFKWWVGDSEEDRPEPYPGSLDFGADVRQALADARDETLALRCSQVGTEHVLLGLLHRPADPASEAVRVLGALGVDPGEVRQSLMAEAARKGGGRSTLSELPYSGGAKRILELAMDEARLQRATEITQRHLLAGVLREQKGLGARALAAFGVTLDALRAADSAAARVAIRIDDASDRSIYEQIVAQVREAVATGRARPGERLPSVRALADQLDVAPGTVARAYAELERLGVVVTEGARGTRIAERSAAVPARVDDLAGLIRPVVVAAYHQGASAADVRAALDRAMTGIYPADGGAAA
jgi:GntR family transcriptional regulator